MTMPKKFVPQVRNKTDMGVCVIGLRGQAGAGKSTVARLLAAQLDNYHGALVLSMAGPLKRGLAQMGVTKELYPDLYREYAQMIGAGMRSRNPEHWVYLFQKSVAEINEAKSALWVVVDDVRYQNEAALCNHLFYLKPEGFNVTDLGARAHHESELWNRDWQQHSISGDPTVLVSNPRNKPERAVSAIISTLSLPARSVPIPD